MTDFRHFLEQQQRETGVTEEHCTELLEQLDPLTEGRYVTRKGFQRYLEGLGNAVQPTVATGADGAAQSDTMTHPINDYFCKSSHNTYLVGDQLGSDSSVERYVEDLHNHGCRSVELDIWDGPHGNPVITHGGTFTTKIGFQEVIAVLADWSFKHSPYPVCLSFENHCSVEQQDKMAAILRQELGEHLYIPTAEDKRQWRQTGRLPRLCDLKFKVRGWGSNQQNRGQSATCTHAE